MQDQAAAFHAGLFCTIHQLFRGSAANVKHWEFWPARLFEAPYYVYLGLLCLRYLLPPKHLAKANYALDHGEIGIGSKYVTQMAFPQARFPPTDLIEADAADALKAAHIREFGAGHGYPIILKPDIGAVGKGVMKLESPEAIEAVLPHLRCNYLVQGYVDLPNEYGVFYARVGGCSQISGINQKHFPTVTGNGLHCIGQLARAHYRYTAHWDLFLQDLDESRVPAKDEMVRLSFVGSHTMGCRFSNDTNLITPELEAAVFEVCDAQPGYNFGRLDVRSADEAALQAGDFQVIEANGVASLPTHMFDPEGTLAGAYRIFFEHARLLARAANDQRRQPMDLASWREIGERVRENQQLLNETHQSVLDRHS